MKVLLLEDHDGVRETMELFLELEGCKVASFSTPQSALKYLESECVDLAILDWNLPGMTGGEFLIQARESSLPLFEPKFVLFSGDPRVAHEARDLGAGALLSKPFRPEALARVFDELGIAPPAKPALPGKGETAKTGLSVA